MRCGGERSDQGTGSNALNTKVTHRPSRLPSTKDERLQRRSIQGYSEMIEAMAGTSRCSFCYVDVGEPEKAYDAANRLSSSTSFAVLVSSFSWILGTVAVIQKFRPPGLAAICQCVDEALESCSCAMHSRMSAESNKRSATCKIAPAHSNRASCLFCNSVSTARSPIEAPGRSVIGMIVVISRGRVVHCGE